MKRLLLFVTLFALTINQLFAQTYVRSASGANNVFPFGSTIADRVQYLYMPSDFIPAVPMGTITTVYFRAASTGTSSFTNLNILIGTTTLTAMPTGSNPWITGLNTCYTASSVSVSHVNGSWFSFTLSSPFFWDGTSNLIIDIYRNNSYTGGITLQQGSVGGNRRMWGLFGSGTSNGGGAGSAELALDIIPGSPCTKAIATATTNINSTSATVNWNAVPGSFKYEYLIDTTTPGKVYQPIVSTTATSAFVTGLIPNKMHYLRVRNYCSAISYSMWDTMAFMTLPPCNKPISFAVGYVDSNSAQIQWDTANNVVSWRFLVDTNRADPSNSNPGIINTTNRFRSLTGLAEGRWHYVHIKTKCVMNDSSGWYLDSFYTPTPCRKPELQLSYLSPNNAVIYWSPVKTVVNYEYFFGKDMPTLGTPIKSPSIQTPYIQPNKSYTVYVKCNCSDNGIKTSSGWASIDYTTPPPLSINNNSYQKTSIETYPNPVKNSLVIKLNGNAKGKATATITDVKGAVVRNISIDNATTNVDVAGLASGVYILQYSDAENNMTTKFTKE